MSDRFLPPESPTGAPFWAASRDQRLVLPWCVACNRPHWYPRGFCPHCLADDIEWRPSDGRGTVYAVSVQPKTSGTVPAERAPYAVVLVDLDDGVRMMLQAAPAASAAEADPFDLATVTIGQRVTVGWEPLPDGRNLPNAVV